MPRRDTFRRLHASVCLFGFADGTMISLELIRSKSQGM